jgi:penicillin amidase
MAGKIFKYSVILGLVLVVLILGGSVAAGYFFGRDIQEIRLGSASAERDAEGIWQLRAPDRESLWHAVGYLQAHDRYFQIELTRHAALGRLAEIFGQEAVSRDRLSRAMAAIAYEEFQKKSPTSDLYRSAQRFADGVNEWRASERASSPVEFRFLNLNLSELPAWEPWHVYAISFYQAWLFSYDLADENRHAELLSLKGPSWVKFFDEREIAQDGINLYAQSSVRDHLKKPAAGFDSARFARALGAPSQWESLNSMYKIPAAAPDERSAGNVSRIPFELQLGASNAWIGYNPDRKLGPLLCNDPHLNLMWPSSMYPIKYVMGEVRSNGWMLPGQPFLVMGGSEDPRRIYAWGITLANYANVQDRVPLSPAQRDAGRTLVSRIRVRDPHTYESRVLSFNEKWTPWGPVASEWFEPNDPAAAAAPWAIDWMGFRGAEPPYEFFLSQNFDLGIDTPNAIAQRWQSPVVNFHWAVKDKTSAKSHWGHIMTGMIFSGPTRAVSAAKDRTYYAADSSLSGVSFLSSANQQVWDTSTSARLAPEWGSPLRARRIEAKREENFNSLGHSQIDEHSMINRSFVRWARARLDVSRLCAEGPSEFLDRCQHDLAQLDTWDGAMNQNDWRPSLAALWISHLKWRFWITKDASTRSAELSNRSEREIAAFVRWGRSGASQKLIWNLTQNPAFADELRKNFKLDLNELVRSAFSESFALLEASLGQDRKLWNWGNLHRVAWQHPMLRTLGPNLPFVGPPVDGADDAPQRASSEWDPRYPLLFPVIHGAVQRTCYDLSGPSLAMRWTSVSGPSGNPFSRWSQTFSREAYFARKWVDDKLMNADKAAKKE